MDRLRQRADFLAVANGTRANSAAFVVQGRLRDDDGPIRIGFTVTKKNGTATERNRIRRRLRELVKRLDVISMRPHHDYVLVGRRAALTRDFATMLDDLRSALHRLDRQPKPQRRDPQSVEWRDPRTMTDNRNTILAVILSGLVLIAWQYFYNMPQMERQRAQTQTQAELNKPSPQTAPGIDHAAAGLGAIRHHARRPAGRSAAPVVSRDAAIAASPAHQDRDAAGFRQHRAEGRTHRRPVAGEIPRHRRSRSRPRSCCSRRRTRLIPIMPSSAGSRRRGSTARLPDRDTVWQQEGSGALSPSNPVTLKYDNGEGLTFRRTIAIDDRYLFTIKDDVTNVGSAPVTLYPFALISRHGTPEVSGYYILHEGPDRLSRREGPAGARLQIRRRGARAGQWRAGL